MNTKEALSIRLNHVILINGFQKLSMSKLAQAINVSRATLYIYFKNKDEIVGAVVERQLNFIQKNPVPDHFAAGDFPNTLLNSLLLFGATTVTFTNELKAYYPERYAKFVNAHDQYFADLENYYRLAQDHDFIDPSFQPDFLLFQNRTGVQAILTAVQTKEIEIGRAEIYLKDLFILQLIGFLTADAKKVVDTTTVQPFIDKILIEFRATYSQIG
ncbi:TetR/AcrR family transcriptional regulator [Lapidilactobacillus luobeiensis]|uniref:TetR/AcrR family transcriptional regulator n=1 Tax=Lapidilactobacillus luobeiensis TaxID=2950371 RepID=UPI0021C33F76|nr:TetR/AcrR family transcriptional regulator [Lapidilactobacillus luobeiensis]